MKFNKLLFKAWIDTNRRAVHEHKGLDHYLLNNLDGYCINKDFLRQSLHQMYHLVLSFPFHIAGAIANSRDEDMLKILVHNLYAEIGGETGDHHIEIYRRLLRALNVSTSIPQNPQLWDEVITLENLCSELYRSYDMGLKLGALFAFEEMSSPMVSKWNTALSKLNFLSPFDYEFFTIHIDIEIDHAQDIVLCSQKYYEDEKFRIQFSIGMFSIMSGLENFWDRMKIEADKFVNRD